MSPSLNARREPTKLPQNPCSGSTEARGRAPAGHKGRVGPAGPLSISGNGFAPGVGLKCILPGVDEVVLLKLEDWLLADELCDELELLSELEERELLKLDELSEEL